MNVLKFNTEQEQKQFNESEANFRGCSAPQRWYQEHEQNSKYMLIIGDDLPQHTSNYILEEVEIIYEDPLEA